VTGDRYEKFERQTAAKDDSIVDKVMREVELAGSGLVGGIKQGIKESVEDPWGSGLRIAGSVGIGLALGGLRAQTGLARMTGELGAAALGTAFVADVVASRKSSIMWDAVTDTWKSPLGFERNKEVAQETLGRFAFDTAAMTVAGLGAAKLSQRFIIPKNETTVAEMLKNLTEKDGIKWHNGRPVPSTLANSFENFPVKAKNYIETGKDAVVIELVDNTVLKVMQKPLAAGLGTREFDLPILRQGTVGGGRYQFIVQPKVEIVQDRATANQFADQLKGKGFNFWDRDPTQLGIYKGQVKLVDYDAVAKFTVGPYAKK
jgi:hypothetical protein